MGANANANADAVPGDGRDETEAERLDRNWQELLQELRVTQTGTQILTGFLLTLPFQQRFATLDDLQRTIYLVLVGIAALATLSALAPVSLHRALFRMGAKPQIVQITNALLALTLLFVAITLTGTTLLIFAVVAGLEIGLIAGGAALLVAAVSWLALPQFARSRRALALARATEARSERAREKKADSKWARSNKARSKE